MRRIRQDVGAGRQNFTPRFAAFLIHSHSSKSNLRNGALGTRAKNSRAYTQASTALGYGYF
jgi:hypothetical protein